MLTIIVNKQHHEMNHYILIKSLKKIRIEKNSKIKILKFPRPKEL